MDFLIDTFRKLERGEIKIDHSPKWMRSNVTTHKAISQISDYASRLGFNVPQWGVAFSLAANAGQIESSKVNMEITKLQTERDTWKQKYEYEYNKRMEDSTELVTLYTKCKRLEKRVKELEK